MPITVACQFVALKTNGQALASQQPDNFLQQEFWGRHKAEFGWQYNCLEIQVILYKVLFSSNNILVLERNLRGGFSFLYIPHAPALEWVETISKNSGLNKALVLDKCASAIQSMVGKRCLFVRFDLPWEIGSQFCKEEGDSSKNFSGEALRKGLDLWPLTRASSDIQPPDTVILDLRDGAEAVLAGMKPKTRYNIRLSEKKGVQIVNAGMDQFAAWYELYLTTARRDQIAIHSAVYYRTLLERNPDSMSLLLAYHDQDLLAGTIMMFAGRKATYLYGASSNLKRNLMPAYALQWAGINAAIARSCFWYDFGGLPPTNDPDHAMHGLFQFKTGFGGNLISMPGSWDRAFHPVFYRLLKIAEKIRHIYFKKLKKRH